jgi:hypothetical protein
MIILLFLRNFFLSMIIIIVCIFGACCFYGKATSSKSRFIENLYWCLGTLIGMTPVYAIPLLVHFLTY